MSGIIDGFGIGGSPLMDLTNSKAWSTAISSPKTQHDTPSRTADSSRSHMDGRYTCEDSERLNFGDHFAIDQGYDGGTKPRGMFEALDAAVL
jgi:hypothetical protein